MMNQFSKMAFENRSFSQPLSESDVEHWQQRQQQRQWQRQKRQRQHQGWWWKPCEYLSESDVANWASRQAGLALKAHNVACNKKDIWFLNLSNFYAEMVMTSEKLMSKICNANASTCPSPRARWLRWCRPNQRLLCILICCRKFSYFKMRMTPTYFV